jgi:pimeloyl-ACP methyl ester carboxylesterase
MNKPPIVFIHGMWSTPHVWAWFKAHYEAAGHVCHAPALPYHDVNPAESPSPILSTIGVQDYVDALLAAVRDLPEKGIIIGHSMGGMLAQKLAEAAGARACAFVAGTDSDNAKPWRRAVAYRFWRHHQAQLVEIANQD